MKIKSAILSSLFLIVCVYTQAQIKFENGYFINNQGVKTSCLIKNKDWKNNPKSFEYKLTDQAEVIEASIDDVQEFGIDKVSKYIRKKVKMDRSGIDNSNMSQTRNPLFEEEQLFLKVLVEGKANLFFYEERQLKRYFFNQENSDIEQLVFKLYEASPAIVGKNNQFRQQLMNSFQCDKLAKDDFSNLSYRKKDLVKLFMRYNNCHDQAVENFDRKEKRDAFHLSIRPGVHFSSLTTDNAVSNYRDITLKNQLGFRLGIEAEFVLPFNKNKWALAIEPTYQRYAPEKTIDDRTVNGGTRTFAPNYNSIEIPLSVRHYLFLNDNSKFFLNASMIPDLALNSSIEFKRADGSVLDELEMNSDISFGFGVGYKHANRFAIECRYNTSRDVLTQFVAWDSSYNGVSFILGYSLF